MRLHHPSDHLVEKRCMSFGSNQPREICMAHRPMSADFVGPRTYDLEPHPRASYAQTLFGRDLKSVMPMSRRQLAEAAASPAPGDYSPPHGGRRAKPQVDELEIVLKPGIGAGAPLTKPTPKGITVAPGGMDDVAGRLPSGWYGAGSDRVDLGPSSVVMPSPRIRGGAAQHDARTGIRSTHEIRMDAQKPGPGQYEMRSSFVQPPSFSATLLSLERNRPVDWSLRVSTGDVGDDEDLGSKADIFGQTSVKTRDALTCGTNGTGNAVFLHSSSVSSIATPTFGTKEGRFGPSSRTFEPGPGAHPFERFSPRHIRQAQFGSEARPKQMPGTQDADHPTVGMYELGRGDMASTSARSLNAYGRARVTEAARAAAARWSRRGPPVCTLPLAADKAATPEERKRATKFFRKSFLDQRPSLDKLAGTASLLRNTGAASLLSPLSQTLSRTSTPR